MTYRKANLTDSKELYELICDLEEKMLSYEKFYDILNEQLQDRQHYYFLLCEDEERVLGILNLRFERQLHHAGPVAEILEFYTVPDRRRQGLGNGLFEKAVEIAKEFGCRQIEADSSRHREETHRFYERHGMEASHIKFTMALKAE